MEARRAQDCTEEWRKRVLGPLAFQRARTGSDLRNRYNVNRYKKRKENKDKGARARARGLFVRIECSKCAKERNSRARRTKEARATA
jgi:hypothetical protein